MNALIPCQNAQRFFVSVCIIVAVLAATSGCSKRQASSSSEPSDTSASAGQGQVYHVRGQIVALPESGKPGSGLQIHHEPMPEFIGAGGAPEPMKAMTMPFPVAGNVSLAPFAVGDKVKFTLSVNWPANKIAVTSMKKLPANTKLDFGQGESAAIQPAAQGTKTSTSPAQHE